MNTALKALWLKYTADCRGRESEWTEIEAAYSAPGRLYHTLSHLSGVYDGLSAYYGENIPAASVFALFYHDYIYSPLRGDNEKQSADYAFAKLSSWQVPSPIAAKARSIILATADHQSSDEETVVFLDADMAVLGSAENTYKEYITLVRKEFSIYPDLLYNRGRRKFIEGTLNRKEIFLTPTFREKYEDQARINLSSELKSLS
jgi:predicted metal-dependent HD superfamily phosphohydrolase